MATVAVHRVFTTPEWWEIAGYHPRELEVETHSGGRRETIRGVLRDDGTKPEGAPRKPTKPFSVTYKTDAKLANVALFLWQQTDGGRDLSNLVFD